MVPRLKLVPNGCRRRCCQSHDSYVVRLICERHHSDESDGKDAALLSLGHPAVKRLLAMGMVRYSKRSRGYVLTRKGPIV